MKMGIGTEADWPYVGAVLARTGDDEQVEFFRAFVRECKSWGTHFQVESQLACINLKLTKEERETLSMLGYQDDGGKP